MEAEAKNENTRRLVMKKSPKAESSEEQRVSRRLRHKIKRKQDPLD